MTRYTYNKQGWGPRKKKFSFSRPQLLKNLILAGVALGFIGSIALLILIAFASHNLPNPNSLTERAISQTTKIFDRTGEHLLYEIFGDENRTLKQVQEGFCKDDPELETNPNGIPLYALQATITAEDRNFCKHGGFDAKGFMRAVFQNLQGNRVGGSTLTQQLVKNAILSNEKTITRKIKELVLSIELERRYSKDEILQIYFNEIPYGSTYYGIEAAAQNFFHKSANELTLAQAVTLASLPKSPTTYINNPDRLLGRRNYILEEMLKLDFINQEEYDQALLEETPLQPRLTNIEAPHFVFFVKERLEEKYGSKLVEEGGLKVITTLDYDQQIIAQEEVTKHVDAKGAELKFSNAALVAMDPKTSQILSMVGSKDFFDTSIDGQVNIATRLRQPGSSFKPIVYVKAFEKGYTPNTVLWDVNTNFPTPTGTYTPRSYDGSERGPVRLRDALQLSLNISAVKIMYLIGLDPVLDFATSLGYSSFSDHSAFGLSVVLGGGEVQLLEHTNTYATFANDGVRHDTVSILRVEDADGTVLEEWKSTQGKRVIEENAVRTLTNVLSDNNARAPVFGLSSPLQLGDRPVAAKTGTTNNNRDAWLMGYTPSLVVGVWAGNNNNKEMSKSAGGFSAAGPIWQGFFKRALANKPIESFNPPSIVQTGKPILDGQISSTTLLIDKSSGKIATQYTPESYQEERTYAEYHSILHYIDRNDPLGPAPEQPEKDPYYKPWEEAITQWIQTQEEKTGKKISQETPPTESDDVHIPENFPSIKFTSLQDGASVGRMVNLETTTTAPRGVKRVEFYLDGFYLGSSESSPFKLSTTLPNTIDRGFHTIKAIAYDDVENQGTTTVGIHVTEDPTESIISLVDPKNGQTIETSNQPYTIVISLKQPSNYSWLRVQAEPIGSGVKQSIGQQNNPSNVFPTFEWTLPESGSYALFAEGMTKSGQSIKTTGIVIKIIPTTTTPSLTAEETTNESDTEVPTEIFIPENPLILF